MPPEHCRWHRKPPAESPPPRRTKYANCQPADRWTGPALAASSAVWCHTPALAPAADLPPMSAWQQSRTVVMSGKVTPGYFGYYFQRKRGMQARPRKHLQAPADGSLDSYPVMGYVLVAGPVMKSTDCRIY